MDETKLSKELLDNIEKIKNQLLARINKGNLSQSDYAEIVGQIDFFEELQSLSYGDLLENYFKGYEDVILRIKEQATALGVRNISGTSLRQLDSFIDVKFSELLGQAEQYSKQLKSELLKNLIAGVSPEDIAESLNEIPLTNNQLRVAVNSGIAEFERISTAKIFEDEPNVRYYLFGVDDNRNRPACDAVLKYQPKEGWTKEEIDNGAVTEIVKQHAAEFAQNPSSLEQALKKPYTFASCGGFNCRHRFRVIEESWG